jgi:hypothetical protein
MAIQEDPEILSESASHFQAKSVPGDLTGQAIALIKAYHRTGDVESLHRATTLFRDLVANTRDDHPDRAGRLSNLGNSLELLFPKTGDLEVLREAADASRAAVAAAHDDHPDHAGLMSNLGLVLHTLAVHTRDLPTLREAVAAGRGAAAATPDNHPKRLRRLAILSTSLCTLFEQTGELAVMVEAVDISRGIVEATHDDHLDRSDLLLNLSINLRTLSSRTGELAALDEAVALGRTALAAAPEACSNRASYLTNLASCLASLFKRTGELDTLKEAIDTERAAIDATPGDDYFERGSHLSNLSNSLGALYRRTGELPFLQEAIHAARAALAVTPETHHNRPTSLASLSGNLHALFQRTGDLDAIYEAVSAASAAAAATPDDHPDRASLMSHLGALKRILFGQTGGVADLVGAVNALQYAVDIAADDHPDRAGLLSNLVGGLCVLFEQTGEPALLWGAVRAGRAAVAATGDDHPDLAGRLTNLGGALRLLFERTGEQGLLHESQKCWADAATLVSARVGVRVAAARWAADVALMAGDATHALAMAELATELLGLMTPRRLHRDDRQHQAVRLSGLAATVATAAIAAGQPQRAVELLEQVRGRLITDTLDTRSDLNELHRHAPDLAVEFSTLREAIDAFDHQSTLRPAPQDWAGITPEHEHHLIQRQHQLDQWDDLLGRIREIPELATFLLPLTLQQLSRAAANGPVVYVIVHSHACHAVVLREKPHELDVIPLPGLSPADAATNANRIRAAHSAHIRDRAAAQEQILQTLAWTWDSIAGPVLTHLGYATTPRGDQSWPRLWWCPVGIAAFLPLHAAGHHTVVDGGDSAETVMDRVVSSYTPTSRALVHARDATPPGTDPARTLIISVPDADHTDVLPGVEKEIAHIRDVIPDATVLPTAGSRRVNRQAALAALPHHEIVHFACHALQNWTDPADSRLILHDHETHPLTLAHITQLRLTNSRLAYLSACSTADTNQRHTDEATHLTTAFQLAGYRSVVGTLWAIGDAAASAVTHEFYRRLIHNAASPPNTLHAAAALHNATRSCRNRYRHLPVRWAPYIHAGD